MVNKKAQGGIITIVLIILVVLLAIILVWNVVKKTTTEKSEEIGMDQFTMSLSIDKATLANNLVLVPVTREAGGGELIMIRIIFKNDNESTFTYENSTDLPDELETKMYSVTLPADFKPVSFKVYPIIKIPAGSGVVGMEASGSGTIENINDGGCTNMQGSQLQECCNNWASENEIIHIMCVGRWIINNDTCAWDCETGGVQL